MDGNRDPHWLRDILDSAHQAMNYLQGVEENAFYGNVQLQGSVAWRITIIGEAARRVSEATQVQLSSLPWKQIVQMRNKLVHEYGRIRAALFWSTVKDDLPTLIREIENFIKTIPGERA